MQTQAFSQTQCTAFRPLSKPLSSARFRGASPLGDIALFAGLDPGALQELESGAQTRVVEKGGFVFLPGDAPQSVYFLTSGRIKISRLTEEGKEFILDLVEPGRSFGESEVFDGSSRETTAEALERSILLSVPSQTLRHFLARHPSILMKFTATLGCRQKHLEKRLVDLAHKRAPRRLAELLVQLSQSYGVRDARGTLLRIKLSQAALGGLLGVSREVVNQAISDLRRRGVIDVSEGRVIIRNWEALAARAA